MITKQELVVISAYTGILMCSFSDVHEYVEKILGRPVFTHEMGRQEVMDEIREKSKSDFLTLCRETRKES